MIRVAIRVTIRVSRLIRRLTPVQLRVARRADGAVRSEGQDCEDGGPIVGHDGKFAIRSKLHMSAAAERLCTREVGECAIGGDLESVQPLVTTRCIKAMGSGVILQPSHAWPLPEAHLDQWAVLALTLHDANAFAICFCLANTLLVARRVLYDMLAIVAGTDEHKLGSRRALLGRRRAFRH